MRWETSSPCMNNFYNRTHDEIYQHNPNIYERSCDDMNLLCSDRVYDLMYCTMCKSCYFRGSSEKHYNSKEHQTECLLYDYAYLKDMELYKCLLSMLL